MEATRVMRVLALDLGAAFRGGQRQTFLVARELARAGHQVAIAALSGGPLVAAAEREPLLRALPLPAGSEAAPPVLVAASRAARRFRPDVVWAGDSRGHGVAVWSRMIRRCPLAVHRRVVFPPSRNPLSRIKYARADRYLAVSEAARDALLAAGIGSERIAVVFDGLPPEAFVTVEPPPPPPFRIVHAGAFDGEKGQGLVVEVVRRLVDEGWDVTAELLGEGVTRPAVEAAARDAGLSPRCSFPGEVDDVPARLSRAHLLLLPSASEAAPLVVVEALAAGCPVLGHDVGGVSEVLDRGRAGRLLADLDPARWTTAAKELLSSGDERLALVLAGRALAGTRTLASTARRVEEELAALCREAA